MRRLSLTPRLAPSLLVTTRQRESIGRRVWLRGQRPRSRVFGSPWLLRRANNGGVVSGCMVVGAWPQPALLPRVGSAAVSASGSVACAGGSRCPVPACATGAVANATAFLPGARVATARCGAKLVAA